MRLQRYLAQCGIASRRKSELLIAEGRVSVNGQIIVKMGFEVNEIQDRVELDGKHIYPRSNFTYWVMNKPTKVITALFDPRGRTTVADLLPNNLPRLFPVGRLDYNTSGLLLLTDDGDLAFALTHPSHQIYKTYRVQIKGKMTLRQQFLLRNGITIEGKITAPAKVKIIQNSASITVFEISIREGRNRQIRKMCEAVGHQVISLVRTSEGPLSLGDLPLGCVRPLTQQELNSLLQTCGLNSEKQRSKRN